MPPSLAYNLLRPRYASTGTTLRRFDVCDNYAISGHTFELTHILFTRFLAATFLHYYIHIVALLFLGCCFEEFGLFRQSQCLESRAIFLLVKINTTCIFNTISSLFYLFYNYHYINSYYLFIIISSN